MNEIVHISRAFFEEVVQSILETELPEVAQVAACGVFGYGSECFGMDDEVSRDHHFGLRIDVLLPDEVHRSASSTVIETVGTQLPSSFRGYDLREGHVAGAGLAPESLEAFLTRTIGLTRGPETNVEWLKMPEEDIVHVTNGEVWYDPSGTFTGIRDTLSYYPDPVWLRRISHWCRYLSGMGVYALNRALIRKNYQYASITFARSIKWAIEIAFMLNRQYFPYDKWLDAYFRRLPTLADQMVPLVDEAVQLDSSWQRKLEILETLSDILDARMVEMGIIAAHPPFVGNETSGYRLLEHAYADIVQNLPDDVRNVVPQWDQVYLEEFHTEYVNGIMIEDWDRLLNLTPV
ncbi:MAG: hypothetical protein CME19_19450 [Gemmatimonadetes bacterium]|nr:hypothetical protein [Gemmatimonadota bacterium]|tara:strand:+ start:1268 stop:2311 length:1044 start_codon:yes stop_codon:yes gene_type:complete